MVPVGGTGGLANLQSSPFNLQSYFGVFWKQNPNFRSYLFKLEPALEVSYSSLECAWKVTCPGWAQVRPDLYK